MTGGLDAVSVEADVTVTGAERLGLRGTDADDGNILDPVDWAEATAHRETGRGRTAPNPPTVSAPRMLAKSAGTPTIRDPPHTHPGGSA